MTTIRIKHIDTFTKTPHNGNPAAVVLDAEGLTDTQMASVAREMNLAETAFILQPKHKNADVKIRWFTPLGELTMSGHATIAALYALAEENLFGMNKPGKHRLSVETNDGVLPAIIEKNQDSIYVSVRFAPPDYEKAGQYKVDLIRLLNISVGEFDQFLTIQRNGFLFAPLRRLHTLFNLKPNIDAINSFLSKRDFEGLCVFTTETIERKSLIHSRVFAPHVGIDEDPVTGFTHCSLALYLHEKELIPNKNGRYIFQAEQGDVVGRKGRLDVEVVTEENQPTGVIIGGYAITVLEGELRLPD
ncbi:MAG: PhzF family phenazine biosynthesis protein [Ignavibacteriae bacterium]|nr:PhzF family phenazine biosynthesis protein [Ignavibacteriota bacterium]